MSQPQTVLTAGIASAGAPVAAIVPGSRAQSTAASAGSSFTTSSDNQPKAKAKKNKSKKKKKHPLGSTQSPGAAALHPLITSVSGVSPSTVPAASRQPATSQEGSAKRPVAANAVAGPSTRRFSASLPGSAGSGPNNEKEEGEISEGEMAPRRSVSPSKRVNPPVPPRRSPVSPSRPAIPLSGQAPISSQYQSYRPRPRSRSPPPRSRMSVSPRRGMSPQTPPLPSPPRFPQHTARQTAMPLGATPVSSYHPSRPSGAQQPVRDLVPARKLSSADERWRYKDKLKDLLLDGYSPAELRRRGADDYVLDQVLRDLNEDVRARQQQPRDRSQPIAPSASSSTSRLTPIVPASRSQQEPAGRRDRRNSTGSESEAEDMLDSLRLVTESPPPPPPTRSAAPAPAPAAMPRPQSSWAPPPRSTPVITAQNAVASSSRHAAPPAIKVESYRPPPLGTTSARPPSAAGSSSAATAPPIPTSSQPALHLPASTTRPAEPVAPAGPVASGSMSTSRTNGPGSLPAVAGDAAEATAKATKPDKAVLDAKIAARMAMLATRRKVMESQARRRAALAEGSAAATTPEATFASATGGGSTSTAPHASVQNPTTLQAIAAVTAAEESTSSLEDQVADLEKEIMGLKQDAAPAAADDDDEDDDAMELDEPEEGEIILPSPPAVPVNDAAPAAGGFGAAPTKPLPAAAPRGIKRPNAEEMQTRPKSMSSRAQPPPKRRAVFGGPPLRANRLLFHLDDESDESDDSDFDEIYRPYGPPRTTAPPLPPVAGPSAEETQRLLAEKEESIRRLKEEIAAKLRIKLERKKLEREREQSAAASAAMSSESSAEASNASPAKQQREHIVDEASSSGPQAKAGPNDIVEDDAAGSAIEETTEKSTQETIDGEGAGLPSSTFRAYKPLLNRYRQLASTPNVQSSFGQYILPTASAAAPNGRAQDLLRDIDHSLLASIILTRRLQRDPAAVLCPAEVGGGSCADPSCEGIHFRKGLPDTADLVEYIQNAVSVSSERIRAVLTEAAKTEGASGSSGRKVVGSSDASAPSASGPKGLERLLARVAVLLAA